MDAEGRRGLWLAEQLGVDKSAVSLWMNLDDEGRPLRTPSEENQRKISQVLGRDPSELFFSPECTPNRVQHTLKEEK